MRVEDTPPQPDQLDGAPHPRETDKIFGQDAAQQAFLSAFNTGRLHQAWMITGPRGVGKATLAWRIARFLLSQPVDDGPSLFGDAPEVPTSLDVSRDTGLSARIDALSEPRLTLCRRAWDAKAKRLKKDIGADEVRKLKSFFTLSATDGGWRVAIIDAADELTTSAANGLLKILEEPPERTVLLLVCHQPARLLPTIRSRCRALPCVALGAEDLQAALTQADVAGLENAEALSTLAAGSVGAAIRLHNGDGTAAYANLVTLFAQGGKIDRSTALTLADSTAGREKADQFDLIVEMIFIFLQRLARYGATTPAVWQEAAPHEARILAQLSPNPTSARRWATLAQDLSSRVTHARAVNLDPSGVILDMLLKLDATART